jgi:cation:H+ antiporter
MLNSLFIFIVSIFLVGKGASVATRSAGLLAETFHLSRYTVGFIVVAVIAILPETFIAINAAAEGIPSFGLATLFGSNIADLTIVFALLAFFARRGITIETKILKTNRAYPFLLLLPLLLGLDGYYGYIDGIVLLIVGGAFYVMAFRNGADDLLPESQPRARLRYLLFLLGGMIMLLLGAHFVVTSASELAMFAGISPVLIGMLVVGLGTTIPETLFALKAVHKHEDDLAVGDILGTVLADATIVVGILAMINPFQFPVRIVYVTGSFMLVASILLFYFMHTGRVISRKESLLLVAFWALFVCVEFVVGT